MKKILAAILAVTMLSVLVIGCTPKTGAPTSGQNTTLAADNKNQEEPANQDDSNNGNDEKSTQVIEAQGVYNGQADNNFIEIKLETANEPAEFSIMEIEDSFKGFNIGDMVKITYIVNDNNQNIIKSIEKIQ